MKDKRAEILMSHVIYIILVVLFAAGIFYVIAQQKNGAAIWEEFYAKEISRIINLAKPGDEILLNVQKATEIARKNELRSFSELFQFNNPENEICVKLSPGRKTCYSYFNEVDVTEVELKLGIPENYLYFKIKEVKND